MIMIVMKQLKKENITKIEVTQTEASILDIKSQRKRKIEKDKITKRDLKKSESRIIQCHN